MDVSPWPWLVLKVLRTWKLMHDSTAELPVGGRQGLPGGGQQQPTDGYVVTRVRWGDVKVVFRVPSNGIFGHARG
jgi:hypothetical protein